MHLTTYEANRAAVGPHAKSVRLALLRLGMRRCSERLVRYQCEQRPLRPDWYALFWRWLRALWQAHRPGFDFIFEDLCARVAALRESEARPQHSDWYEQIATCAREHGEALQAAIQRRDPLSIRRELVESIEAERRLLAMLECEAGGEAARAA